MAARPSRLTMPKRPHSVPGDTVSFKTGCGTIFVTVSVDEFGYPVETFARGKGGCMSICLEALGKAVSVGLRCGVDAQEFVDQFKHMICPSVGWDNGVRVSSCAAALGMAICESLKQYNNRASTSGAPDTSTGHPDVVPSSDTPDVHDSHEDLNNVQDEDIHLVNAKLDDEARVAMNITKGLMAERDRLGLR